MLGVDPFGALLLSLDVDEVLLGVDLAGEAAQCVSLFKPVTAEDPVDIDPLPNDHDDRSSLWWRQRALTTFL